MCASVKSCDRISPDIHQCTSLDIHWLCYNEGLSVWHMQDEGVAYVEVVTVDYDHTSGATPEI